MATANKNEDKKTPSKGVMDVSKPGKTAASATSRPLIVGHKSNLKKDPMVADSPEQEPIEQPDTPESKPKIMTGEKVLEPLKTDVPPEPTEKKAEDPEPKATDEEGDNTLAGSSSAAVDALASEVTAKRESEKASEEDIKRLAEIEGLVASRKYFVPIGEVSKRRMNHLLIALLFIILLAVIGLNFVIDAELIETDLQPLTDLL